MVASRRSSIVFCTLVAVLGGGLTVFTPAARAAAAGDPAAIAKVTNLNKKALDAYAQQDFDSARDLLKQALELCESAGLEQHPITARTHIHFGVVAIAGFKQRELGLKHFRKALEIEPDIKLTKSLVTPQLQDAFEEAVLAGDTSGGAAAGSDENGNAAPGGEDNQGATAASDEDEDHPRKAPKPRPKKKSEDDDEKGEGEGGKGTIFLGLTLGSSAGIASGNGHLNPTKHMLGGPGFAVGQLGQIEPQIGYFLNATTLLSLAARLQYVSGLNGENLCGSNGSTFCNPLTLVGAVLARATWFLGDGSFHWTLGGQIGGGYVAHAVVFPTDTACGTSQATAGSNAGPDGGHSQCVDALLGGPFLIGPTVGFMYELSNALLLTVGVDTELGAPKFTFNFDIDAGLALRL